MSKKRRIPAIFLVLMLFAATALVMLAVRLFGTPTDVDFSEPVEVTVPRGASLNEMASIFRREGLIDGEWEFILAARICGLERELRAGRYRFEVALSPVELVRYLTRGGSFDAMVTFPEGSTVFRVASIAADSLGIDSTRFVDLALNADFADSLGVPGMNFEGYLYPETYSLPRDIGAGELIARMFSHFERIWTEEMSDRARELGMDTNQVMTLASIIEGEARVEWERRVISSVYHNRLRCGMLLQADPTVKYGLRCFDRKLSTADLDTSNSPYNTYKFAGLPPGPINNPGYGAINAALYPDSSDYLYFVSNRDGTHWFTRALTEHHAAIRAIRQRGEHGPLPEVFNRQIETD